MKYLEVYFNSVLQASYQLDKETIVIGRKQNSDICLNNQGVSGLHAVLEMQEDELFIEDINSTNGTLLNNQKITAKSLLKLGDTLSISKYQLKVTDWTSAKSIHKLSGNAFTDVNDQTILVKQGAMPNTANNAPNSYLLVTGDKLGVKKIILNRSKYTIGAHKGCEVQIPGWRLFLPDFIADIVNMGATHYISPVSRTRITVNERPIKQSTPLVTGDKIKIKKVVLHYVCD